MILLNLLLVMINQGYMSNWYKVYARLHQKYLEDKRWSCLLLNLVKSSITFNTFYFVFLLLADSYKS